jgi:hypothetical protein
MTDWVLGGRRRNIFHGPRPGAIVPLVDPSFWLSSHVWGNCCQLMIRRLPSRSAEDGQRNTACSSGLWGLARLWYGSHIVLEEGQVVSLVSLVCEHVVGKG